MNTLKDKGLDGFNKNVFELGRRVVWLIKFCSDLLYFDMIPTDDEVMSLFRSPMALLRSIQEILSAMCCPFVYDECSDEDIDGIDIAKDFRHILPNYKIEFIKIKRRLLNEKALSVLEGIGSIEPRCGLPARSKFGVAGIIRSLCKWARAITSASSVACQNRRHGHLKVVGASIIMRCDLNSQLRKLINFFMNASRSFCSFQAIKPWTGKPSSYGIGEFLLSLLLEQRNLLYSCHLQSRSSKDWGSLQKMTFWQKSRNLPSSSVIWDHLRSSNLGVVFALLAAVEKESSVLGIQTSSLFLCEDSLGLECIVSQRLASKLNSSKYLSDFKVDEALILKLSR